MNELGAVEKTHQGELVLRDVAPLDPVRDAAHTRAEVPAIADEGDAEIEGQAAAVPRRLPIEREGRFGWVGRKETTRVGVQLQLRIELVQAKALQVMVIRGDIHPIAAGTGRPVRRSGSARDTPPVIATASWSVSPPPRPRVAAECTCRLRRSGAPQAPHRSPHTPARRDTDPRRRRSPESSGRSRAA